jgi:hypothetical protein
MADLVALMDQLGHAESPVVGQAVAYRCALDHPDLVRASRSPGALAKAIDREDTRAPLRREARGI